MEQWCKDTDRWNSMYSEEIHPNATLSTTNPIAMSSREILRCAFKRLSHGTIPRFYERENQLCKYYVNYGLQYDTWHADCTMISIFLRTVVPKRLQGLPPTVRQRLFYNKSDLAHCMGNIPHTLVEHDNSYCIYVFYGFDHWIPCATASVMYLKKQRSLAVSCILFQIYCVTRNQIIGTLLTNLVSLSTTFHLEYCKKLESENHHECVTLRRVIHRICNIFINTIEKHYKHSQFLYCHNCWAVCVNNTDKRVYVTRNFVFNPAGYIW
jgi:hypothetical protein